MIKEMRLKNFKCFEDHSLPLRAVTAIVGRNNAGKSTVVEALRLISLVLERRKFLNFHDVPSWLDLPLRMRGVAPSLRDVDINLENLLYRYGESADTASVTATLHNDYTVTVHIGRKGELHAVICNPAGEPVRTKGEAIRADMLDVSILPQIGPLAQEERALGVDYVRRSMSSSLASLHFRNQLYLIPELQRPFAETSESSWPGLKVGALEKHGKIGEEYLTLLIRNEDFAAEVSWMGHGLQMWLQIMWFLTRARQSQTVILDEPDVYMHADLQRKLIRHLLQQQRQVILTTHSVEILTELEPEQVLVVDHHRSKSTFTTSIPAVQRIVERIGSTHNLQLARLWNARRCLLVEGKDVKILKVIHSTLFPNSQTPLDALPNMAVAGWSGWHYAVGSSMLLKNAGGEAITVYCILDSDYHTGEEIRKRIEDANERGVNLTIWSRKEIENFLLSPEAIAAVINRELVGGGKSVSAEQVSAKIDAIAEAMKDDTFDATSGEYLLQDRPAGSVAANRRARKRIDLAWETRDGRWGIVSGKALLARLSEWSQGEFSVALSAHRIARAMSVENIPKEVAETITAIERGVSFRREVRPCTK